MSHRFMCRVMAVRAGFLVAVMMGALGCAQGGEAPATNPEAPAAGGWKKTTVAGGLVHPWGMAFLPNGDILISERPGRLRLVREGKLVEQPISGVPEVLAVKQGGLMDVVIHPDFARNKLVYFTYASGTEQANRTMLGRGRLEGMELRDVEVLFKAEPDKPGGEHFGSVLLWLADGTLLMSVGDGGNPPVRVGGTLARENGQRLDRHLGKILRLDAEGKAPADNPFVGRADVRPEIYSYGHRNVQGLALDRETGRVWATEHGPFGGDELNLIRAEANYGWPRATHGLDYQTKEPVSANTSLPGMEDPKVVWSPSKAPSGLAFYSGSRFPEWRGALFSGGLVTQDIRKISVTGEDFTGQESLAIGRRVRAVVQGPDGLIYVLTDHEDGELMRLEPAE